MFMINAFSAKFPPKKRKNKKKMSVYAFVHVVSISVSWVLHPVL